MEQSQRSFLLEILKMITQMAMQHVFGPLINEWWKARRKRKITPKGTAGALKRKFRDEAPRKGWATSNK